MKIKIHSIHFDADTQLLEFIQEKVDRLIITTNILLMEKFF